jgi:hypothetical protein
MQDTPLERLTLHVTQNSLIAKIHEMFVIPAEDPRYVKILKVMSSGFDEVKIKNILLYGDAIIDPEIDTKGRIEFKPDEDKLLIDKIEMPKGIKDKFAELQRRHKPRTYLLRFWDRLQQNPNPHSIEMLYKFLEHNGHPIMSDGKFIAYKAVTMDMLDHHTKTNKHKVGCIIRMDRGAVVSDPNKTCESGLHVATWEYAANFHPGCSRYLEVLVDPKDVVSVPVDYAGTKMRVCAYKVYREVKEMRQESDLTSQIKALQKKVKARC